MTIVMIWAVDINEVIEGEVSGHYPLAVLAEITCNCKDTLMEKQTTIEAVKGSIVILGYGRVFTTTEV